MMEDHLDENADLTAGLRAFETLGKFMENDGWHPQAVEDNLVYRAYFVGHNGEVTCFAQIRADLEQFIFYVVMPVRAPAQMRLAVAEYLTRANYGLRIGNFEMDFDDGEVRYKSSVDFEGVELTPGLIRNVMYPAVQTMDRYLPGVLSVVFGGKSAEEAIIAIEEEEG
ncbi:MAG: YbjN domain-containing protein [Caldilineaceae bacterium]|nr:YbjN domain-containing protein [Caldilineaceae bacterium]